MILLPRNRIHDLLILRLNYKIVHISVSVDLPNDYERFVEAALISEPSRRFRNEGKDEDAEDAKYALNCGGSAPGPSG